MKILTCYEGKTPFWVEPKSPLACSSSGWRQSALIGPWFGLRWWTSYWNHCAWQRITYLTKWTLLSSSAMIWWWIPRWRCGWSKWIPLHPWVKNTCWILGRKHNLRCLPILQIVSHCDLSGTPIDANPCLGFYSLSSCKEVTPRGQHDLSNVMFFLRHVHFLNLLAGKAGKWCSPWLVLKGCGVPCSLLGHAWFAQVPLSYSFPASANENEIFYSLC